MPAPVAVYILVGVVGAAAASFAFKEFVYEPHLAEKVEELKYKVRAYYRRQRTARELARAQPFRPDIEDNGKDIKGHMGRNGANVELQGLFKPQGPASSYDAGEMRMRANAGAATGSLSCSPPPPISKTTSADIHGGMIHDDQSIRQRNHAPQSVDELLDLEEKSSRITVDPITPTAATNSLNPFLDQKTLSVNVEARQTNSFQKDDPALSNTHSFSPSSKAYSFGVESPVILSPLTSPGSQANPLPQVPSSHDSSNPWEAISREASPPPMATVISSMSGWETGSEHIQGDVLDVSDLALLSSRDFSAGATNPSRPVTSPEIAWPSDENDNVSEASFSTGTTTFSSSIGSDVGEVSRELNPFLGNPVVEYTNGSVNSLSDSEWEHFSDIGQ